MVSTTPMSGADCRGGAHTRLGLTDVVRTWGFTTAAAADGEEALQRINAFRPSHHHHDLVMPRMAGASCCARSRMKAAR